MHYSSGEVMASQHGLTSESVVGRAPIPASAEAPTEAEAAAPAPSQIPERYGETRIVLQVRDPFWMHAYWEISEQTALDLARELGDVLTQSRLTLRVNDMICSAEGNDGTDGQAEAEKAGVAGSVYMDVHPFASNWYINVCQPDRSYCVDLGVTSGSNGFRFIARSNIVHTPRVGPSEIIDEEWLSIQALGPRGHGLRSYAASPGIPVGGLLVEHWARQIALGSGGVGAVSSPAGPPQPVIAAKAAERQYWLRADAELVVYGATEPGSHVRISGMPAHVASDGTFSVRMAFPEGKLPIEVTATSADQLMSRRASWTFCRTRPDDGE